MENKKTLVNDIINSLRKTPDDWNIDDYTFIHKGSGIELWHRNMPILDIHVYSPFNLSFSIIDKFRLYFAMNKCRQVKLLILLKNLPSLNN